MIQELNPVVQHCKTYSKQIFLNSSMRNIEILKWNKQIFCTFKGKLLDSMENKSEENERRITMQKGDIKTKHKFNFGSRININQKIDIEVIKGRDGNKTRAVVDIKVMQEELKQLQDPPITPWELEISSARLSFSFYNVPCETLANNLLGKVLVRKLENGTILKGRIVETESYLGIKDKASHTYEGKVTPRNIAMYMQPGTIYIYFTYGMYYCFNISSQESGNYVLIKRIKPLIGLDYMELLRNTQKKTFGEGNEMKSIIKNLKDDELCNGPIEVCEAFKIDKDEFNGKNLCNSRNLWIE